MGGTLAAEPPRGSASENCGMLAAHPALALAILLMAGVTATLVNFTVASLISLGKSIQVLVGA